MTDVLTGSIDEAAKTMKGSSGMRVRVDSDRCIGSGNCVVTAPDVFDQDDEDGTVVLRHESVDPDQQDAVRQAVTQCPAQVISIDES